MVCPCSEFKMGTAVEDQQLSCLWQGPHILSLSLSGCINYLDVNNPATPLRILKVSSWAEALHVLPKLYPPSHRVRALTSTPCAAMLLILCMLVVWMEGSVSTVYVAYMCTCGVVCEMVVFFDSIPCYWGVESGQVDLVSGQGHTNVVCCLRATPEMLLSLGLDKNLKTTQLATNEFRYHPSLVLSRGMGVSLFLCSEGSVVLSGLDPTGLCVASDDTTIITTLTEVSTLSSAPDQSYYRISV